LREQYHIIPNPYYRELPKQPKGHCRYCGKSPLPPLRKYYCNDICGTNYRRCSRKEIKEWWAEFRERIFKRDDYTCLDCGYTKNHKRRTEDRDWTDQRGLDAHHIVPISKGGSMWDWDNLETLCNKCHKFKHRIKCLEPTPESRQSELEKFMEEK